MGGYLPNPVAVGAMKTVAYSLFGWLVRSRSARSPNPLAFGVVRVAAGWLVGIGFALLVSSAKLGDREAYAIFLVPRFLLWAFLLHIWFLPHGGWRALAIWSIVAVALSTALDLIIFRIFTDVPLLRMTFC
jgi:hypothetical protein